LAIPAAETINQSLNGLNDRGRLNFCEPFDGSQNLPYIFRYLFNCFRETFLVLSGNNR